MDEKKDRVRRCKIPYCCIRCGYSVSKKTDMYKHLYTLKKQCPATENLIELTDEVKAHILENRIYMIPKLTKLTKTVKRDKTEICKLNENEYYNYIYLLRPEESVLNSSNIYKIGMSVVKDKTCNITRLSSYRTGSELIFVCQCTDANKMENEILKIFNNTFKRAYGNEYFIGNKFEMVKIINSVLESEEKNIENIIPDNELIKVTLLQEELNL